VVTAKEKLCIIPHYVNTFRKTVFFILGHLIFQFYYYA